MNLDSSGSPVMTVYGAPWCPHCRRVKKFLAAHRVRYTNVDIDAQPEAIERLKELQGGGQIIPTVVYPDGTHEVNPGDEALAHRIGLTLAAGRSAYDLVIVGGGPAGLAAASARPATDPSTRAPARSWSSAAATRPWRRACTCPSSRKRSGCWLAMA